MFTLNDRVAVVTGAARGIGARIAAVLAEAGATVVVADLIYAAAERTAAALIAGGRTAHALALDVSDESSVVAACAHLVADHGVPWLLVNNAGLQDRQLLLQATVAEWDRINEVNVRGPFLMTRELGQAMATAGTGGRIVNIASNVLRGSLVKGQAAYAASKGALLALSSVSAFELAEHAITVNTILPGSVFTPGSMGSTGPDSKARRCVKRRLDSSKHAKSVWRCSFSPYRRRAPSPIKYWPSTRASPSPSRAAS